MLPIIEDVPQTQKLYLQSTSQNRLGRLIVFLHTGDLVSLLTRQWDSPV